METYRKEFGDDKHRYSVLPNPDWTNNQKLPYCSFYNGNHFDLHGSYDEAVAAVEAAYRAQTDAPKVS